ncbi:MAG: ECF transporter S component [Eubacteriales bacterium]|nr:ECF transporter S component [Eubacteriales bacterium]
MNTTLIAHRRSALSVRTLTVTAMLAAVSYILAFAAFPVPLSPAFAKMDLSDFPALIGAFAFGPMVGVLIELVKNALQLLNTSTGGVGELANFLMGGSFALTAGLFYRRSKTRRSAMLGCAAASGVMGVVAALTNYFILLPLFEQFMPLEQVIAAFGELMPFIRTKLDVVLYNAFPFNLLKGLVISLCTMVVYKKLSPILKGRK